MNIPTLCLYTLMLKYLKLVDAGDLSDARTQAHDEMMAMMRAEFFDFVTREDAREVAREVVKRIRELAEVDGPLDAW